MTIEELEAVVSDLQAEKEAMQAKNKEILSELKKAKAKTGEFDMEKFLEVQEKLESVQAENAKLQGDSKLKLKDFDKLSQQLAEKDKSIHKLLVNDGIMKELASIGIDDFETHAHRFESKAIIENGVPLIDGKTLKDAVAEWAMSDSGQRYVPAPANSGSGATGGQGNGGGNTVYDRSKMSHSDKAKYITEHGQDAYLKLP